MDETRSEAALRRSGVLLLQKRWLDAIDQVKGALTAEPDNARLWCQLAVAHANVSGHEDDAIAALRRARFFAPDDPEVLRVAGSVLLDVGHRRQALVALRKSARLEPGSALVHALLAKTLHAMHRNGAAANEARVAVFLDPQDASYRIVLAEVLLVGLVADEAMVEEARSQVNTAMELDDGAAASMSAQSAAVLHRLRQQDTREFVAAEARLAHWSILTARVIAVIAVAMLGVLLYRRTEPVTAAILLAVTGGVILLVSVIRGWVKLGPVGRSDLRFLIGTNLRVVGSRFVRVFVAWVAPIVALVLVWWAFRLTSAA
jgi:Flp pilus assembly protein TadD